MVLLGRHVDQILLAAFGHEIGLGDHGDTERGEVVHTVVGHHGGVLDAVIGVATCGTQRGDGDDELGRGHAVHRHRCAVAVAAGHPVGEVVEVETVVMQDAFSRCQVVQSLPHSAVPVHLVEFDHLADIEVRGGIGDTGDAMGAEPVAQVVERGVAALQGIRPGAVGAAQPPVGMIGQADGGQSRGVQRPQDPAAVLDAHRHRRGERVQPVPVQRPGHRLVVPHRADPPVLTRLGGGQHPSQIRPVTDVRGPDPYRMRGGRSGMHVYVMVVQAGDDRTTGRIVHLFTGVRGQMLGHRGDLRLDPEVDHPPVEQGRPLNQHDTECLSSSSACTAAPSAPSADAGDPVCGLMGSRAGPPTNPA